MKEYNCDLQLHGIYAGGVSNKMLIPTLAEQAKLKGLDVLVSADALHAKWLEHLKENLIENSNGVYTDKNQKTYFIIGTEVEDNKRIHHLIYLPSLESAFELREKVIKFGTLDCSLCGRPKLRLTAEQIAQKAEEVNGIIGPAHSFTPYTGLYAHFDSVKTAYGNMADKISFIELGLSADTHMADTIAENHKYTYLSSSDAHSPWPNRLGREFNRIKMQQPDYKNLVKALKQKDDKLITLNTGLDPREGKYHKTACIQCFTTHAHEQAKILNWKCLKCKGEIKRGVIDRIQMLADTPLGKSPSFRPPYMHSLPLAEIIQLAIKIKNPNAQSVQSIWKDFVERFETEIKVLIDAPESELMQVNENTAKKIIAFRKGYVTYIPGGGGKYGEPIIFESEKDYLEQKDKFAMQETDVSNQKTLTEFFT